MEIEYGWAHFRFELSDVKFNTWVELQEKDDDGDWEERDIPMLWFKGDHNKEMIEKWEQNKNLRYSKSNRSLSATAKISGDSFDQVYLGVPKDKSDVAGKEGRVESVSFQLNDIDEESVYDSVRHSKMIYFEGNDEHPRASEEAILTLTVPPDVMDNIEKVISTSNITFLATVNLKCWNFTGPIGDSHLYINKEHWEPAELVNVTATKVFSDHNFDYIYDDPNYDGSYVDSPDVNVNIYKMLSRIEKHLKDVRSVVVAALVVGLIALIASKYLG